jgi:transposase-like protein
VFATDEAGWFKCPMCSYKFTVLGDSEASQIFENLIFDNHIDDHVDRLRLEMMNI